MNQFTCARPGLDLERRANCRSKAPACFKSLEPPISSFEGFNQARDRCVYLSVYLMETFVI